jgi:NAD(P)-dependent dehydrogenase (short-subunit alcohol dehydrogenase family)
VSVLITGAAAGIGAAISGAFAKAGRAVAVTDVDEKAARAKAEELKTLGLQLDVLDRDSIRSAAETTEKELGPLEAWISNAGVSTMARFTEVTEEDWDLNMDVNAKGVFLCGQEAARRLRRNGGGAIVNTASMAGKRGGAPFLAHYVASKFAVVGLTQAMAAELAADGIRVNCVCPGYVVTGMQERELEWEAELRGVSVNEVTELYVADTPLGRLETPEDVAAAVLFLASSASSFITGESLAINGGSFMD